MLYIIGPRGAGKTTIGKRLAETASYPFIDTDALILQRAGMTIAEFVKLNGWEQFRQLETEVLTSLSQLPSVISTGGGIILAPENRQFMRDTGTVIYLNASVDVLADRLSAAPEAEQRPSLTGKSILDEISEVMATREPLYLSTAHHIIDAQMPVETIVRQLIQLTGDLSV